MTQGNTNQSENVRTFVPAVCTQCGAHLEVDPSQEAAVCQYCGTPFIVQKAINEYNIQNARIEHVDTVNIQMKSTADSFFGFLGKQLSERRQIAREERREARERDKVITATFFKVFGIVAGVMILLFFAANIFGFLPEGEEETETNASAYEETDYDWEADPEDAVGQN